MKKTGNRGAIFASLLFMSLRVFAEISLKAEMHPEAVGVGDQARIILSISSDADFENQDPDFPPGDGFRILQSGNAGRSSSSRVEINGGRPQFSKTVMQNYEFIVQFTRQGTVQIPSISVSIDGKVNATAPFKISVSATPQNGEEVQGQRPRGALPQNRPPDPFGDDEDDMFSQLMQQRQRIIEEMQRGAGGGLPGLTRPGGPQEIPNLTIADANTNESFFIHADVDKKTAYEGEQITTNWSIFVKGNIESLDRAKFPDLKGFWKEIIEEVPGLQFNEVIVNGINYRRALLASHALFPIKAGVSVIDEFKIKAKVRNLTQFGWGQPHEYTKSSRRIPVQVLPLPQIGKPLSFSGAVGQFQIQTHVDSLQVKAGQPFTVKLTFEGSGNAKLIELPPIAWPESLSVFDTKSESKFFKNSQSFKEFELLLVQSKEGSFQIPAIQFSYFDPQLKNYVTKSTEEISLTAVKSDLPPVLGSTLLSSGDVSATAPAAKGFLPQLELPGDFSWIQVRYPALFAGLTAIFILGLGRFLIRFGKMTYQPSARSKIESKIKMLVQTANKKDHKRVGSEAAGLIDLLIDSMENRTAGSVVDHQDVQSRLGELPLEYKEKYHKRLAEMFDYFQTVGFAPEELRNRIMQQRSIEVELKDLKNIAHQVAADVGRTT